jgi:hypothetical protein
MGLQSSLPTPKIPQEFGGYIEYFPEKSSVAGLFQQPARLIVVQTQAAFQNRP